MIRTSSLLQEVAELRLTSKWVLMSSPLLRPNQSKTLRNGRRMSFVGSLL